MFYNWVLPNLLIVFTIIFIRLLLLDLQIDEQIEQIQEEEKSKIIFPYHKLN